MTFTGIPADALVFYSELEANNSKPFWEDNKERFKAVVREPATELAAELSEFGEFHLFRPHNDLRFAKNKPPYKTHQGAYTESEGGAGFYFHISAEGLMCASGYYSMAKDQLQRFRAAVDDTDTGEELVETLKSLKRGYQVSAISELKTAPRGYPKDHPRIEILRRKGLMASQELGAPKWLHTKRCATRIREIWNGVAEVNAWLDTHVGPSELEPAGFFG